MKWSYESFLASPLSSKSDLPVIDSITCPDKYTVIFHTKEPRTTDFFIEFHGGTGSRGLLAPPEPVQQYGDRALNEWQLARIGTGPWIVTDVVEGSSITMKRNPDYWDYSKYWPKKQLPFADGVQYLMIKDTSTQLAALRTGKIDWHPLVNWDQVESLEKTSPWLKKRKVPGPDIGRWAMNTKVKPYNDVRVRQAMNMAIDYQAIVRDFYKGNAEVAYTMWPLNSAYGEEGMPPVATMPQIVRDQFEYKPEKAKQLLAEAGYPNGFKTDVICLQEQVDVLSIGREYLKKVGVDMEIRVMESGAHANYKYGHTFPQTLTHTVGAVGANYGGGGPAYTMQIYLLLPGPYCYTDWEDPNFRSKMELLRQTQDYNQRIKLMKEAAVIALEQAPYIALPGAYGFMYWQPWIKGGYWGQYGICYTDRIMQKYWWIDQELKKSILERR